MIVKEQELADLRAACDEWMGRQAASFQTERDAGFVDDSGIPIKRVYTPLDLQEKGFRYMEQLGFPGDYPLTRGITPTMYRSKPIAMTQYMGHPAPEESNAAWRSQIAAGTKTISMAYDLPTQLGYDPDDPMAEGEAGRIGVSMFSLRDWEVGLEGIDLSDVTVYQVMNAVYIAAMALHVAMAERQGVTSQELTGIGQNDILKEYIARGNFIFAPRHGLRLVADTIAYATQRLPKYFPITVCGYHQSERGATGVHEVASMLGNAFTYLQAVVDRGVDIDAVGPKTMLFPSVEPQNLFQEIAKLRATRRIYARVLRDRFGAKDPQSWAARIYAAMGGLSLHREQYLNNVARGGLAAFAAACAGCQMVDLRAYDEQFGIPTSEAAVQSIHTMQTAAYETGVMDTVDPLGGSYFVESLTNEYEEKICEELEQVEKLGGVLRCIETGYYQRQFSEDAYKWQRDLENGKIARVGVNIFRTPEGEEEQRPVRVYRANQHVTAARIAAVQELRKKRDNVKVRKCLEEIKAAASAPESAENSMVPSVLEAMKSFTTVGEVAGVLREVWGAYERPSGF